MFHTRSILQPDAWPKWLFVPAQADVSGITIVIRGGDVKFGLVGQPTPQVLIQALEIVRDDILKSVIQHELEQEKVESDIPAEALEEIQNNIEKVS